MFKLFKRSESAGISANDLVNIVERAYSQAWWDSQRAKHPRYEVSNKTQGLARFMRREAENLKK